MIFPLMANVRVELGHPSGLLYGYLYGRRAAL